MTDNEFDREAVLDGFAILQQAIHQCAVEHGWWETERGVPECLMLIVSELSEALEDYRGGDDPQYIYTDTRKPCGFPVELADACIRILDLAGHLGIDLADAILAKHSYNLTRPHRHGGKKA